MPVPKYDDLFSPLLKAMHELGGSASIAEQDLCSRDRYRLRPDPTTAPREQYRISVITLFGSLFKRLDCVRRVTKDDWFLDDPDGASENSAVTFDT